MVRASRGAGASDKALYTSATLALNPDNGKLAWYFQHVAGETLDLDEVYERVLVDVDNQKLSFEHRQGRHLMEARPADRQILNYKQTVFQNVFDQIDEKTGEPRYRSDILEARAGQWIQACPSTEGGHNWQAYELSPGGLDSSVFR